MGGSFLAEMEGFEPPDGLTRQLISSQPRYDHFDTSPNICQIIIANARGKIKQYKYTEANYIICVNIYINLLTKVMAGNNICSESKKGFCP